MSKIELSNVNKFFGENNGKNEVLKDFSLECKNGEFLGIFGPSGCGKTTLLRIIAGLEKPNSGKVFIGEECVSSKNKFVPPQKRDVGLVFQNLALWPHLKVSEQLEFVLKSKKNFSEDTIHNKIDDVLGSLNLSDKKNSYPAHLSGGEKQRLALGRVLVQEPKVLLLDEPLANLDPVLREKIKGDIVSLKDELEITTIYVTHIPAEVLNIADRIAVMQEKILHISDIKNIDEMDNEFIKNFLEGE